MTLIGKIAIINLAKFVLDHPSIIIEPKIGDLSGEARIALHVGSVFLEFQRRTAILVKSSDRRPLTKASSLLLNAITLEVLMVKLLYLRLVEIILTEVHENLLPPIQVDLHPVEDVLD